MQQESQDADGEADEPHHEPPVPVETRRLLLQPVAIDLAVRRQVLQALVGVEHLALLVRVLEGEKGVTTFMTTSYVSWFPCSSIGNF